MDPRILLAATDISFRYGTGVAAVRVLSRAQVCLSAGELIAILGPSGCGKSTLLRILAGLHEPTAGTIQWRSAETRHALGMVFQEPTLLPWRTVEANARFCAEALQRERATTAVRCRTLLERFGIAAFAHQYPSQLSLGMQQRLALARALVARPTVLFLDEAMSGSDLPMRSRIERTLVDFLEEGTGILMVSHDLDDCLRMADRLIILSDRPAAVRREISFDTPRAKRMSKPGALEMTHVREQVLAELSA